MSEMLLTYPYLGMNEAFKTALSGLQRTTATYAVVCRRKKSRQPKIFAGFWVGTAVSLRQLDWLP
jgi:hypothetical protein